MSDKHTQDLRLANYKKMHEETAKNKNVAKEFAMARTLTAAKKVLFGLKKKNTR